MRIDDVITESINPDILNPDFQHRQEIDGFVYTAESKVYFNKLDTLKIRCYNHENEEIASVLFEVKQGKWLQAVQVVVEPEYRGEGLANTMYAYAKMLGNTIKPSGTQTDQGKAMWAKWGTDARHLTHEHNKTVGETELSEAFDQPYAIEWAKTNGDWHATADLDDGSELIVLFMSQGDNQWMVEFERDENMEITGEGDAPRVFATVLTAMRQFIAKRKPAMLNFSAEKEDDPTGSRARLYDRMIQRYITGTGYTLTRQDYPGGATYTLTQIQKPVKQPKQEPAVAEDQINELGNAPADYKANRKRKNSLFHATVEGHWVDVFFDRSEFNGTLHITFTVNGDYDAPSQPTSASKSTVKILSTVLSVIKQKLPEYIKKSRPPGISFTSKQDNRTSLYRKYFVPVIQDILGAKWAHEEYPNMGMTVFHWKPVAKSKPVTEDQDYMAGHCHVMAIALKMLHPAWQIRAHVGWEDDEAEDDEYRVDHVYIVAPDGSAYDCRGRFDSEEALVGEDVTGGFETQYADFDLADIQQLVQRGELKRFTREDINKAVAFAKRIQQ